MTFCSRYRARAAVSSCVRQNTVKEPAFVFSKWRLLRKTSVEAHQLLNWRGKKKSKNRLLPGVSASGPTAASRGDEKREYFQHLPPFENSRFQALRESLPPAPDEDKQNAVKARRHRNALKTRRADGGLNALALRSARSPRRGPTRPQRSPTAYTGPSTPAAPIRPAPSAARPAPPRRARPPHPPPCSGAAVWGQPRCYGDARGALPLRDS